MLRYAQDDKSVVNWVCNNSHCEILCHLALRDCWSLAWQRIVAVCLLMTMIEIASSLHSSQRLNKKSVILSLFCEESFFCFCREQAGLFLLVESNDYRG